MVFTSPVSPQFSPISCSLAPLRGWRLSAYGPEVLVDDAQFPRNEGW